MARLEGKVAVVTGANSGIGLATAKRFAREGGRLFITGRRQPELDAAVRAVGGTTTGIRGDVSNMADLDRLYDVVREEAGVIDILFANAGSGEFMPLQAITEDHYDRTFATNVKGTLFTVQKALPLLRDGASVILTGSVVAIEGTPAFTGWHGLAASEEQHREMLRLTAASTPLGRLGDPDEIASAALFLASDESSFVNGAELFVDGGSAQI